MITQAELKERLRYEPDTGKFFWRVAVGTRKPDMAAGAPHRLGYLVISIKRINYLAHRLAWLYEHGSFPDAAMEIDHINHDKRDNRLANLRLVSPALNSANSKVYSTNKLGVRGVSLDARSGKYHARIKLAGKDKYLGSFPSIDLAAAAFRAAAIAAWGDHYRDEYNPTQ